MKMEKCFGGNKKIATMSIDRCHISLIDDVVEYCKTNDIDQLIIMLSGDIYGHKSIVEKEGLIELVETLPEQSEIDIHIIREGLGYNLSYNDYKNIFNHTIYQIENMYSCDFYGYQLCFYSNNLEDHFWDDQYFIELMNQARSSTNIKVTAAYKLDDHSYLSSWCQQAWKLSEDMNSKLIYLDDGDIIIFDDLCVYMLKNNELTKIKDFLHS